MIDRFLHERKPFWNASFWWNDSPLLFDIYCARDGGALRDIWKDGYEAKEINTRDYPVWLRVGQLPV